MKKTLAKLFMALAISLLLIYTAGMQIGCGGEDTEISNTDGDQEHAEEQESAFDDPEQAGKYNVGAIHTTFYDAERDRELPGIIWYPTNATSGEPIYYQDLIRRDNVFENAPVAEEDAPYPLMVFSHGNGGVAEQSWTLTEYLARHGFIVAACDHIGNTAADWNDSEEGKRKVPQSVHDRPLDISTMIDNLLEWNQTKENMFHGKIDSEHIAASGHSLGGFTTLLVCGAYLHFQRFKESCTSKPDDELCNLLNEYDTSPIQDGIHGDDRVKVGISYAPAGYMMFEDDGIQQIKIPMMIVGGERDGTCTMQDEIQPIYNALNPPKALLEIENAGHMSFTNMCDLFGGISDYLREEGCGEGFVSPEDMFKTLNRYSLAFLRRFLYDDSRYDEYLSQSYADRAGLPAIFESKSGNQ